MNSNSPLAGIVMGLGVFLCVLLAVALKTNQMIPAMVAPEVPVETKVEPEEKPPTIIPDSMVSSRIEVEMTVLEKGQGVSPQTGDRLRIHYRGSFPDGKEFDSSHKSNTPYQFVMGYGQILKGLEDGLRKLAVGSRARMQIPWQLAYGEEGIDGVIPPRQDLIYEVELLSVEPSGMPEKIPDTAGFKKNSLKGMEYYVLKDSEGKSPKQGQRVSVHFVGWLPDGKVFDSSVGRGIPFSFLIGGRVIEGWNLLIPKMKVGQKVLAILPPSLAYGDRALGAIPANSPLIFQIELLEIF